MRQSNCLMSSLTRRGRAQDDHGHPHTSEETATPLRRRPPKRPWAAGRPIAWLLGGLLLITPGVVQAQPWSGILSVSRATDWSQAGVAGGIPNRTTLCATLNPGASASQINSAIAACPSGQVVFLNAGTYNLSAGLTFSSRSYWIPGSWNVRMVYTDAIPFYDP
jgi:hypothetical protein